MTLEEAIWREKALAYSFRKRIENMETTNPTPLEDMEKEHLQYAEWLRELKAYKDNDMELIYTNPLEEAIRCAMCTNTMRSDRGCDGGCKVDEQMYKEVLKAVYGLIEEVNADEKL